MRCAASALASILLLAATVSSAHDEPGATKRVLVISTGSRLAPGFIMVDQQLLKVLGEVQSPKIEIYAENLDIVRFPAERARRVFSEYLSAN